VFRIKHAAGHGIQLEVIKNTEAKRGFIVLPRRWVVEPSFARPAAWLAITKGYLPHSAFLISSSSRA
jgi:hypothetical protein